MQMVLAIESCHKHGFIHRDIKPDVGIYYGSPDIIRLIIRSHCIPDGRRELICTLLTDRTFCSTRKDISG